MPIFIDLTEIVHERLNQVYLERIAKEMEEASKLMALLQSRGWELGDIRNHMCVDLRSEGIFYLALSRSRGEFEHLVRGVEYCGYVVDEHEVIHCISSSSWIAQFDGCKESEIEHFHP